MFPGMITLLFAAVAAFVAGIVVATYFERNRTAAERASFEKSSKTLLDQLADTRTRLDQARNDDAAHQATIARLEERHAATERVVEQMRVNLPETFKSLANEVLEEKSRRFAEQNQTSLGQVLEPLKTRLEDFQTKIEAARMEQVRGGEKLSAHIDKLFESNTRISDQANNLAIALRGSSKAQGAWGELILERTLASRRPASGTRIRRPGKLRCGKWHASPAGCGHPSSRRPASDHRFQGFPGSPWGLQHRGKRRGSITGRRQSLQLGTHPHSWAGGEELPDPVRPQFDRLS